MTLVADENAKIINTDRISDLETYFDRHLPEPKASWLWELIAAVGGTKIKYRGIEWTIPKTTIFKSFTEHAYKVAARGWLRPHQPAMQLDDLRALQSQLGQQNLSSNEFRAELRRQCLEFERSHAPLRLWIENRLALLEFLDRSVEEIPEELSVVSISFQQAFLRATGLLAHGDYDGAIQIAKEISAGALEAAAEATRQVLGKGGCGFSANLMVPMRIDRALLAVDPDHPAALRNHELARTLWSRLNPERCLIVAAETRGADHIGFWVPLIRGEGSRDLPGASRAFYNYIGSAVFKDDIPTLWGFPDELSAPWRNYIRNDFREHMFVSLPLVVPKGSAGTGSLVVAVLNVNADPPVEDGWRRAYHREWLELARKRATPFVLVAFQACLLRLEAQQLAGKEYGVLDTGASTWNFALQLEEKKK